MVNEDLPLQMSRMSTVPGRIDPVRAPRGAVNARCSSSRARILRGIAIRVCAAMTLLVTVVSHGSAQAPPPNRNVADSRLTVKINTALWSDLRFPGKPISVDTQDGAVTLSGQVRNAAARSRAVELARAVPGVRSVRNELTSAPLAGSG